MIERIFSVFLALGDLTTIMKSYSAFGPNFRVILFVSSFEMGFSMYQDSCLISEFTMFSDFLPFSASSGSSTNGNSGLPNLSLIAFLLNQKLVESIESSTIYSHDERFVTFSVDPRSLPGKNEEQLRMYESTYSTLLTSTNLFFF